MRALAAKDYFFVGHDPKYGFAFQNRKYRDELIVLTSCKFVMVSKNVTIMMTDGNSEHPKVEFSHNSGAGAIQHQDPWDLLRLTDSFPELDIELDKV